MIALPKTHAIADYMEQQQIDLAELVRLSGLDDKVVEAMVHQRYTPTPRERHRISEALGVAVEQVIWGHRHTVESHIHAPD